MNFGLVSYNVLNTDKTIVRNQDFEGDGRIDGPFIYVSADANAAPFYTAHSNTDDGSHGRERGLHRRRRLLLPAQQHVRQLRRHRLRRRVAQLHEPRRQQPGQRLQRPVSRRLHRRRAACSRPWT